MIMYLLYKFNKLISYNCMVTTAICMLISVIVSIIPSLLILYYSLPQQSSKIDWINAMLLSLFPSLSLTTSPSNNTQANCGLQRITYESNTLVDYGFISLLLDTIMSAIPMALEVLLDIPTYVSNVDHYEKGIYRIGMVVALIIPNIILYILFNIAHDNPTYFSHSFLTITQIEFADIRVKLLIPCILNSLFCTKAQSTDKAYEQYKKQSSLSVMYVIILYTLSGISFTLSLFPTTFSTTLETICFSFGNLFLYMAAILLIYFVASLLQYDITHYDIFKFNSPNIMSDFFYCLALLLFQMCLLMVWIFDLLNRSFGFIHEDVALYNYSYILLYFQLFLTFVLTIIPGRCNQRQTELNEEKLQTRLNLIRYVSHEMRTPLNTAVLGVKLVQDDIQLFLQKYKYPSSVNTSSSASSSGNNSGLSDDKVSNSNSDIISLRSNNLQGILNSSRDYSNMNSSRSYSKNSTYYNSSKSYTINNRSSILNKKNDDIHDRHASDGSHFMSISSRRDSKAKFEDSIVQNDCKNISNSNISRDVVSITQHNSDKTNKTNQSVSTNTTTYDKRADLQNIHHTLLEILSSCHVAVRTLDDLETYDNIEDESLVIRSEEQCPWKLLNTVAAPFEINAQISNIHFNIVFKNHSDDDNINTTNNDDINNDDSNNEKSTVTADWSNNNNCVLRCDTFKISQVIRNLISNALKFTPTGGQVTVTLERVAVSAVTVTTSVNTSMTSNSTADIGVGFSDRDVNENGSSSLVESTTESMNESKDESMKTGYESIGGIATTTSINGAVDSKEITTVVLDRDKIILSKDNSQNTDIDSTTTTTPNATVAATTTVTATTPVFTTITPITTAATATTHATAPTGRVLISVQDTGPGISFHNQSQLFGQYIQFNAAQLQQGKGSGLGLWISKNIVEMHGGRLMAYSGGEGYGSTFTIELPCYLPTSRYTANL